MKATTSLTWGEVELAGHDELADGILRRGEGPDHELPRVWKRNWAERIQQEYRRDFRVFGYPMEPPASE